MASVIAGSLAGSSGATFADPPDLAAWIRNTDGHTGYAGAPADVQAVYYSNSFVYVECTAIPTYTIGPWPGNPNVASNQNWRFKIARQPVAATTHTATPLGHIGLWSNGVVIFNARDAQSYQNQNVWRQNAIFAEANGFDACLGHPQMTGSYHHHQNPLCLYSTADTTLHSPILGYAFDGFPIYGPYGYANADGSGGVLRIESSYRARNITQRTTLPDGTILAPVNYGPAVSATYPLGYYVEDFEYVSGLGRLDEYNVRFAVTPEYPLGTYAYVVTINADGSSAYPYALGPSYFGVLIAGNTGPGSGHVTIGESVTLYDPPSGVSPPVSDGVRLAIGPAVPNPARAEMSLRLTLAEAAEVRIRLIDVAGRTALDDGPRRLTAGTQLLPLTLAGLAPGVYFVEARSEASTARTRVIVLR